MFNWAKQQMAYVAGTQEPIYGPSAIRSIAEEAEKTPFTELQRDDLAWRAMESTSVETQIFYLNSTSGHIAFVEVIYSNVAGLRTTCQFICKIFYPGQSQPPLWSSTPLNNIEVSEDRTCFYADDCAVELSDDGTYYTIKSINDERAVVNLKVSRLTPGFYAGTSGTTLFGTDLENPWGSMRHTFWPRCVSEGTISTADGLLEFDKGQAAFIHALQGMKPHHAAATWNFVNFQGPTYSAIMMEFTTPPSYGSTVVNVGCIAKDNEIVVAGCKNTATHTATQEDPINGWPEPTEVRYSWSGTNKDGKAIEGVVEGSMGEREDLVDIMAEVPGFVKTIIAGAAGTKPYIYQFRPDLSLKLKIGDEEIVEKGTAYTEATFISDLGSGEA
ncbi:oxidative stress survival, Svf1-like protein [Dactylonectria macrodidyma]|uniref:Oxidative stress survival, Svf1-like protein n=1 Tax=Dactylonectria macrodidyma TaxID=307937 RepID=A0A9P9FRS0_9HYPO|nr:oxidative stress survival, Svf1-like protein [Dactylonectria macrodidyma]